MPSPPRRRHLLAGAVVALLGAWSAWAGLAAREDLLEAQRVLTAVRDDRPASPARLAAALAPGADAARQARSTLDQPGPWLVSRLPVLGRALAAERDVARAADALLSGAGPVLASLDQVQAADGPDARALRETADGLARLAEGSREPLRDLAEAPLGLVPGSVRSAVEQAREAAAGLDGALPRAADAADALAGLLGAEGQRTLLVVVMNNAELRGAGGYGGTFAVVRTGGAEGLQVGPFQDVNDVQDEPGAVRRVEAPADYRRRWGPFLADTTLWKNTLMSADQAASSAVTCAVARLAPGVPCDGVVLLDVRALASLVELTGAVDLGGEQVAGDRLVEALLVEAYAETEDTAGDQADRRARLRAAADGAVSSVLGSGVPTVDALEVLVSAVRGRHLSVWSADVQEQAALVRAGLGGTVAPAADDLNLVSANQLSAGKLDVYVTRSVGQLAVVGRDRARVSQKVELTLDHPPDATQYVLGVRGGRLDELLDIAVPLTAEGLSVRQDGVPVDPRVVPESGSSRVQLPVSLVDGQRTVVELSYELPLVDGRYSLELLPQPLARDAVLHLAVVPADGEELVGGQVRYDGPFDVRRRVEVQTRQPSWWDRPVRLPWSSG